MLDNEIKGAAHGILPIQRSSLRSIFSSDNYPLDFNSHTNAPAYTNSSKRISIMRGRRKDHGIQVAFSRQFHRALMEQLLPTDVEPE